MSDVTRILGKIEAGDTKAIKGDLSAASGVTTAQLTIPVYHDASEEPTEDFAVSLTDVAGATVAEPRPIGTILNNDDPGALLQCYKARPLREEQERRVDPGVAEDERVAIDAHRTIHHRHHQVLGDVHHRVEIDPVRRPHPVDHSISRPQVVRFCHDAH